MGKINRASNKEAGKSKDPEILLKSSKQKKAKTSAESDGREVLLKVGGFEYKTPTKNTRVFLGFLVLGLNLILVLAVALYFYSPSFHQFIYNVGRN